MANTASNVSTGKPRVAGAIFVASVGATLPTDASGILAENEFAGLGYVSEEGVVNSTSPETSETIAWGGDVVLTVTTSKSDTYAFTLIESLNIDVLKTVYGDSNVSGTIATGITVKHNNADVPEKAFVIDMILRDGNLKRIVIPKGKVSEVGDVTYTDGDAIGYETTISAMPDGEGNTAYEYIQAVQVIKNGNDKD